MNKTYRLDTHICFFIMWQRPEGTLLRLQINVKQQNRMAISAITYTEMQFGTIGKKDSPKHAILVSAFIKRLDSILSWDKAAVDTTTELKRKLNQVGTPIGPNNATIAGHGHSKYAVHQQY